MLLCCFFAVQPTLFFLILVIKWLSGPGKLEGPLVGGADLAKIQGDLWLIISLAGLINSVWLGELWRSALPMNDEGTSI